MTATATSAPAIRVRGLRKSYGDRVVLDGIDLDVAQGSVFALLGPNGAGKTTTIHILSTLLAADAGEVSVGGHDVARDPAAVRGLIGVTGQVSAVDKQFTGEENLRLMADLCHLGRDEGRRRVADLLERFELTEDAAKQAMRYSGGMKRRLDLAMTLIGRPRIIFLDEPTTGLDPRSRRVMWQIVRELVADGVTILLTTQYLEEADRLASRIALLDHGRIVAEGTPSELKRLVPGGSVRLEFPDETQLDRAASLLGGARDDEALALNLASDGAVQSVRQVLDRLDAASVAVDALSVKSADLDDVFLSLTGRREGEEVPDAMTAYLVVRLGDDAPPQPAPDAPLPVADVLHRDHPGPPAAAVHVRARRDAGRGPGRRGDRRRPRRVRRLRHAGDPADDGGRRGPGHRDLGRDGHDRGDHRPLPDDVDRPGVGPRRARRRQRHPGDPRAGDRPRRRAADRLPADDRAARVARPRSGCTSSPRSRSCGCPSGWAS